MLRPYDAGFRMRPERQRRHSIRLKGYDYSVAAAYFVTICTQHRMPLFGDIVTDAMLVNQYGRVVLECWESIPAHSPRAGLDAFVVMPNHIHGIIQLADATREVFVGAQHAAPCQSITYRPLPDTHVRPASLGAMVRSFKSARAVSDWGKLTLLILSAIEPPRDAQLQKSSTSFRILHE